MAEDGRCVYILPKKGRRCKMLVKKGKQYCGEHAVHDVDDQQRIPCPYDPKHTVCHKRLVHHLKKCNARIPSDPWIIKGLNSTRISRIAFINPDENEVLMDSLLGCIRSAYSDIVNEIDDWTGNGDVIYNELMKPSDTLISDARRKQLFQHSSIIGCAVKAGLLGGESDLCVVDFGSGKAELSYWISKKFGNYCFLLLDNQGMRNKFDNRRLKENPDIRMERIRCSVEHVDISKIKIVKESEKVVAISKHLCGQATDWSINCVENSLKNNVNIFGFALAPCCHHKSAYPEYVGKSFLSSKGFVTEQHFNILTYVASWAVCGFPNERDEGVHSKILLDGVIILIATTRSFSGRQAKVLLEYGRARRIQELGYEVKLCQYVDLTVSPENLLIIGKIKPI